MNQKMDEKTKQTLREIKKVASNDKRLQHNDWRNIAALEKAVARLQNDENCSKHLIFKGGFVLFKHYASHRFTRDVDALAVKISKEQFLKTIESALGYNECDDGFWFGDIQAQELVEQGSYGSYRFSCAYQIGNPDLQKVHKLSRIHIDINFNDKVPLQGNEQVMVPILQSSASFLWNIYPLEFTLAEKLHAFVERGSANSRAKDIYDIPFLFSLCDEPSKIKKAIESTFSNRETTRPGSFLALAKGIDQTFLKAAWPGVLILGDKPSFEQVWKEFLKILEEIDKIF